MASSTIGDCGDFLKAFPQYTERDYLYKLSVAKINFLMADSTHEKHFVSDGANETIWKYAIESKKNEEHTVRAINNMISDSSSNSDEYYIEKMRRRDEKIKNQELLNNK